MQKEELLEQLGETYGYVHRLVEKRVDYLKLEAAEKSAGAISGLLTAVILGIVALITLLFALLTLAFYLGSVLADNTLAFGIVTLVLVVILLVVYLLRRVLIVNPTVSRVITAFFTNDGQEV